MQGVTHISTMKVEYFLTFEPISQTYYATNLHNNIYCLGHLPWFLTSIPPAGPDTTAVSYVFIMYSSKF